MKRRRERGRHEQQKTTDAPEARIVADKRPRWFWQGLLGICIFCLARGLLILVTAWKSNPFAAALLEDASVYWNWAGDVASGRLICDTPFLSAPLYPYLLGLIRALGGGLPAAHGVQLAWYVATVWLIGGIATRRFGPQVGLVAAGLFALLADPMFFVGRILNCTLQVFLVCLLWRQLLVTQARPSLRSWVVTGVLAGLNCLANPPMLLLVVALGPWAYLQGTRGKSGLVHCVLAVLAAMIVISPAAIHNYAVTHEFIPLTAESGLTFYHGNHAGADGTYSPVPGISIHRRLQRADAERLYQQAMGRPGNWSEVSIFFRRLGTEYLASNPDRAATLLTRKFYWFLTSRNYGDIYLPTLEEEAGFAGWMRTAPVPITWLIPTAIVAIAVLLRRPNRYAPEIVLFALPLLTVLVFLFNPRYRLPMAPVIAVLAGWAFVQAWQWRTYFRWSAAVLFSLVFVGVLTAANRASGFDALDLYRVQFENCTGLALTQAGRPEDAVAWYRKALSTNPAFAPARSSLVQTLQQLGKTDEALAELRQGVALVPTDASLRSDLGVMLIRQGSGEEAVTQFGEAVRLRPESAEYQNNLGNALYTKGRVDEAMEHYQAALRADPTMPLTHLNIGILYAGTNRPDDALRCFGEAVRLNPQTGGAHYQSALVLLNRGQVGEGLAAMRRAHESAPDNVAVTSALAWLLATTAEPLRDPAAAAALARLANEQAGGKDPGVLDTLAAALAAGGQFAEAIRIAQNALDLAMRQNSPELTAGIRQRLDLYKTGQAYTRPAASGPLPQGRP